MKFKLDENLDVRLASLPAWGDHEADTVLDQRLSGSPDNVIYESCCKSGHVLITLDLDYANPLRFPPEHGQGIVVLRPSQVTLPILRSILVSVLSELKTQSLKGRLWIVEPGRIRIYEPEIE